MLEYRIEEPVQAGHRRPLSIRKPTRFACEICAPVSSGKCRAHRWALLLWTIQQFSYNELLVCRATFKIDSHSADIHGPPLRLYTITQHEGLSRRRLGLLRYLHAHCTRTRFRTTNARAPRIKPRTNCIEVHNLCAPAFAVTSTCLQLSDWCAQESKHFYRR